MSLERYEIEQYCHLKQALTHLNEKKQYLAWLFYQQSFATSLAYTDLGITVQAPRVERIIIDHFLVLEAVDKQIKIVCLKMNYWQKFLDRLKPSERAYFDDYSTFNEQLDQLAIEEIKEIQVAVSFHFGYQDEDTNPIEVTKNDYKGNIQRLLSVMQEEGLHE